MPDRLCTRLVPAAGCFTRNKVVNHFRVVLFNSQGKTLGVSGQPLDLVDAIAVRTFFHRQGFAARLCIDSRPLRLLAQSQQQAFSVAITTPEPAGVSLETWPPELGGEG